MIFRQITHDDLGCASYLIGDEDAGVAAVVDPKLDIDEYLRLARYFGVSVEHILETHNHADHVSGHGRLAAATGATSISTKRRAPTMSTRRSPMAGSSSSARSACALCTRQVTVRSTWHSRSWTREGASSRGPC
jgi:glyoxylase-like metal-dependent hydrolase (beta-lactamase superfamily II)